MKAVLNTIKKEQLRNVTMRDKKFWLNINETAIQQHKKTTYIAF